jgi:hypothetical protein
MKEIALLAGIYQKLVINMSAAGEFIPLANHAEVAAWASIE